MGTALSRRPVVVLSTRFLAKALLAPVAACILVLAPIVYLVCSVMMAGGVLAGVLFEISSAGPRFPFLQVLVISSLCGVLMALYYALVAWILKD